MLIAAPSTHVWHMPECCAQGCEAGCASPVPRYATRSLLGLGACCCSFAPHCFRERRRLKRGDTNPSASHHSNITEETFCRTGTNCCDWLRCLRHQLAGCEVSQRESQQALGQFLHLCKILPWSDSLKLPHTLLGGTPDTPPCACNENKTRKFRRSGNRNATLSQAPASEPGRGSTMSSLWHGCIDSYRRQINLPRTWPQTSQQRYPDL